MSKKDFELIAATIGAFCNVREDIPRDELAMAFGHELADTNPRFNLERFLRACGL